MKTKTGTRQNPNLGQLRRYGYPLLVLASGHKSYDESQLGEGTDATKHAVASLMHQLRKCEGIEAKRVLNFFTEVESPL